MLARVVGRGDMTVPMARRYEDVMVAVTVAVPNPVMRPALQIVQQTLGERPKFSNGPQ